MLWKVLSKSQLNGNIGFSYSKMIDENYVYHITLHSNVLRENPQTHCFYLTSAIHGHSMDFIIRRHAWRIAQHHSAWSVAALTDEELQSAISPSVIYCTISLVWSNLSISSHQSLLIATHDIPPPLTYLPIFWYHLTGPCTFELHPNKPSNPLPLPPNNHSKLTCLPVPSNRTSTLRVFQAFTLLKKWHLRILKLSSWVEADTERQRPHPLLMVRMNTIRWLIVGLYVD